MSEGKEYKKKIQLSLISAEREKMKVEKMLLVLASVIYGK